MAADNAARRALDVQRGAMARSKFLPDEATAAGSDDGRSGVEISLLEALRASSQDEPGAMLQALRQLAAQAQYSSRALARALGISPRQLQRIFARDVGASPQEWLNEQRLLAAHDLLCQTCSVKEVAFTLGFRTVSQFSRDFKDRFGMTPKSMIDARAETNALTRSRDTSLAGCTPRRGGRS